MKHTYRFHLKDGSYKDFEMTEKQRSIFVDVGDSFSCYVCSCSNCGFSLDNCTTTRGFNTEDILSIEKLEHTVPENPDIPEPKNHLAEWLIKLHKESVDCYATEVYKDGAKFIGLRYRDEVHIVGEYIEP